MVSETRNIIQDLQARPIGEFIEFIGELPEALNCTIILATVNRWRDIRDYFDRPVRVYVSCRNPLVEKHVARLISGYDNLFITFIPYYRKEWLESD